jgi:DNA invertase Pin-like site-specific DNA recombinase
MTAKAYAYSRYSSAKQGSGRSLERQLKGCKEWADKRGLTLDTELRDLGVSSYVGDNRVKGALGSFLHRVECGEIESGSYLIVDSLDRLSRETETEVLHMLTGLTRKGIKVVNVAEDHVLDEKADMLDYMRVLIHAARAHAESKEKGRKVAHAHESSKQEARETGRIWHRQGPRWLDSTQVGEGKNKIITFHPIPERVAVVKRVFDLMESGLASTAICRIFNDEGVPSPRDSHQWFHTAVGEIARNRAVIGEYQPKLARKGNRAANRPADGDPIPKYYPAIIEEDQFYRVQAIIDGRKPMRGRGQNTKIFHNVFQGIGSCSDCGGIMGFHSTSAHTKWKRTTVIRCSACDRRAPHKDRYRIVDGIRKPHVCENKTRFKYDPLEQIVLATVSDFELPNLKKRDPQGASLSLAISQRDAISAKIDQLLDMLEDGDQRMRDRYNQRVAELEAKDLEIKKLRSKVKQTVAELPLKTRKAALERLIKQLGTVEGNELYELRASINLALKGIVSTMDFDPDGSVRVILYGGLKAYWFKAGEFLGVFDLRGVPEFERGADQSWA